MMFPLVLYLAADRVPIAVTCRAPGFPQASYHRRPIRVADRDWDDAHLINATIDLHHADPEFGYRFIVDELPTRSHRGPGPSRSAVHSATALVDSREEAGSKPQARARRFTTSSSERAFTADRVDRLWLTDIERHEAFANPAVVEGRREAPVAAGV